MIIYFIIIDFSICFLIISFKVSDGKLSVKSKSESTRLGSKSTEKTYGSYSTVSTAHYDKFASNRSLNDSNNKLKKHQSLKENSLNSYRDFDSNNIERDSEQ